MTPDPGLEITGREGGGGGKGGGWMEEERKGRERKEKRENGSDVSRCTNRHTRRDRGGTQTRRPGPKVNRKEREKKVQYVKVGDNLSPALNAVVVVLKSRETKSPVGVPIGAG